MDRHPYIGLALELLVVALAGIGGIDVVIVLCKLIFGVSQ